MATISNSWTCDAMIPSAKGDKRVRCATTNNGERCTNCGASRHFNKNEEKNMSTVKPATDHKHQNAEHKTPSKPAATPDAPKAPTGQTAAPAQTPDAPKGEKKSKSNRLKFVSTTDPAYYVRIRPEQATKGAPRDFNGVAMVQSTAPNAPSKKVQKLEAKEQEEKLLAGMNDEQKIAYATKKRLEKKMAKDAKEAAKKQAMMNELMKELEAKGKKIVDAA